MIIADISRSSAIIMCLMCKPQYVPRTFDIQINRWNSWNRPTLGATFYFCMCCISNSSRMNAETIFFILFQSSAMRIQHSLWFIFINRNSVRYSYWQSAISLAWALVKHWFWVEFSSHPDLFPKNWLGKCRKWKVIWVAFWCQKYFNGLTTCVIVNHEVF